MSLELSAHSLVVATPDHVACELAGDTIILNLADGIYYGLDEVGARIWALLGTRRTVEEIHRVLLTEYEVESTRCERDLLALLGQLAERALIEVTHAAVV